MREGKIYLCQLYKYSEYEGRNEDGLTYYRKEKDIYDSKAFKTKEAADKFGQTHTYGTYDLFYQVLEVRKNDLEDI